jgi:hypothetical protein
MRRGINTKGSGVNSAEKMTTNLFVVIKLHAYKIDKEGWSDGRVEKAA